jgi:hypothetical protein
MSSYTSKVIAVLGRTLRAGRWKLAEDTLVIALFGRCVLDLTRAYVDEEDEDLTMSIFAIFGSVSVLLPPGCDVEPSGVAIVASSDIEIPSERCEDITQMVLAPLDISWLAMFARVRVVEIAPEVVSDPAPIDPASIDPASIGPVPALDPPSPDVFGGHRDADTSHSEAAAAPVEPTPVLAAEPESHETTEPFDDAASQAAALRDEIAQWRAESGRRSTDDTSTEEQTLSPEDEIIDESERQDATSA